MWNDDQFGYHAHRTQAYVFYSPEIFLKEVICGKEADIWAAGVIFYAILKKDLPFKINPITKLMRNLDILKKKLNFEKLKQLKIMKEMDLVRENIQVFVLK